MAYLDDLSEKDLLKSILASARRGEKGNRSRVQVTMDADDIQAVMAASFLKIMGALEAVHSAITSLPAPVLEMPVLPAPQVYVEPPDLSDIVTAVASLKPGAQAEDVAALLANMLRPSTDSEAGEGVEVMAKVASALEKLDFRLKGMGTQAYGGGSVSIQPGQSIAISSMPSITTTTAHPATGTSANVASSATNVTLLAANANRLGATVYNDSTAFLRIKLGATASASSFSVVLRSLDAGIGGYYEVPAGYTGIIDGIWDSANGSARVTELV